MNPPRAIAIQLTFLLLPIAISLAIGAALVIAVGRDPLEVVDAPLGKAPSKTAASSAASSTSGSRSRWSASAWSSPVRAGLWNIGVEGQMMMGAIFASWGAQYILLDESLSPLLNLLLIALSALGGMVWAFVVGILKFAWASTRSSAASP